MKKYLSILTLALVTFPLITSAAWWNPFTWSIFAKPKTEVQKIERIVPIESAPKATTAPTYKDVMEMKAEKAESIRKVLPVKSPVVPVAVKPKEVPVTISVPTTTPIDNTELINAKLKAKQEAEQLMLTKSIYAKDLLNYLKERAPNMLNYYNKQEIADRVYKFDQMNGTKVLSKLLESDTQAKIDSFVGYYEAVSENVRNMKTTDYSQTDFKIL